jgi:hypothetical protein
MEVVLAHLFDRSTSIYSPPSERSLTKRFHEKVCCLATMSTVSVREGMDPHQSVVKACSDTKWYFVHNPELGVTDEITQGGRDLRRVDTDGHLTLSVLTSPLPHVSEHRLV